MNRCILVLGIFFLLMGSPAWTACAPVFSALSINGTQYPVQSTLNFPPPVVAGTIPLSLEFRTATEKAMPFSGVRLRYTVDNQPIGPVLSDPFEWSFDSSAFPDGTHSLSVIYINQPPPSDPCYFFVGRQYVFVISNSGHPVTGLQRVPVVAPPPGYGPVAPQYADFINYPGFLTHPTPHPFPYQFVPAAGGIAPADFWSEPLLKATSNSGEPLPAYWQLQNGSIVEDPLFTSLIGCDDLRRPKWGFDVAGPFWEQRKSYFDGPQNDVGLSSYAVFTANLDGPGFYGISMDGRLFLLNMDGSIQSIAGWISRREQTPLHYLDGSIPMSAIQAQQTLLGTFDAPFYFPTDVAIDPNNHAHIFVADMNNHRIALVDLSKSPPVISTYAGVVGVSGYRNGSAKSALFNQPSSIAIAPDQTIYVADAMNSAIRKIDPFGNVTTLSGVGPAREPSTNVAAQSPLTYAPRSPVQLSSAYINYPNALRFDSKGNLVLAETVTQAIRYIDLSAQTVTTIAQFSTLGSAFGEQVWLDVDRSGNVGARDDIIASMVTGKQNGLYRVPIAGTTAIPLPMLTSHGTYPLYHGPARSGSMPWTSGPWAVAIDDKEGRMVVSGVQSAGVVSLRLPQRTDPPYKLNVPDYSAGRSIWITGTVPNFPFGSRPSFAALHGFEGHGGLGNVLNFDDMVSMTDAQLATYLQNGAEGSVPRPELTGNDLRNLIYFIRRTTTGGDQVAPGPDSSDNVAPVVAAISATQTDSTGATVTWSTNETTLGLVRWGTTPGNYFGWSPIESSYTTAHSVSLSNLPAGQPIYFVVLAKDQAGNQSVSPEGILNLQ